MTADYKVFIFSDVHFFRGRNDYLLQTGDWLVSQIQYHKPNLVVFGGDANHTHNQIEVPTLHAMASFFGAIANCAKEVTGEKLVAISGNHDTSLKSGGKNTVDSLAALSPNIKSVTRPEVLMPSGILLIPHPPTEESQAEVFREEVTRAAALSRPDAALVHVELSDIRYTPASPHCTEHPFVMPTSVRTVLAGHYHHPATTQVGDRKVHVIGSPCYHTYADQLVSTPRGALLYHLSSGRVDRLENPCGPIYHTIETGHIPFISTHKDISRMLLRVKVAGRDEYEINKESIDDLRKVAKSVRVMGADAKASGEIYRAETSTMNTSNPMDFFNTFCKKKNLPREVVDYGRKLMEETQA